MKIKKLAGRCLSLLLAGTLLLSSYPAPLFGQAFAADGTDPDKPELKFAGQDKDLFATIIRGSTATVQANYTANVTLTQGNELRFFYQNAPQTDLTSKFFSVVRKPGSNPETYTITALDQGKEVDPSSGIPYSQSDYEYAINANYTAQKQEAMTIHTSSGTASGTRAVGSLKRADGGRIPVNMRSEAQLIYKKEGNAPGQLIFKRYKTGDVFDERGGMFNSLETSEEEIPVNIISSTNNNLDKESFTGPQTYTISVNGVALLTNMIFSPNLSRQKKFQATDENGKPLFDDQGNPIMEETERTYWGFENGDTFDVIFQHEESDRLVLTVLGQEKYLNDLKGRIEQAAREPLTAESEFIRLGRETDEINFITENFSLRETYEQYGAKVRLAWSFEPEDKNKGYEDVVTTPKPSTGAWTNVTITPREEDVKGKLYASLSYVPDTFYPLETPIVAEIPITIHGTGTAANVYLSEYTIGASSTTFSKTDKLPSGTFTMDKYRGGIDGYPEPEYPWTATFVIEPGGENGFAKEFVINSTQPEAVKATLQKGSDPAQDYTFGSVYVNEGDPKSPQNILLTLQAETPGSLTGISFQFFIQGGGDSLMEDLRAARSMNVSVIDTSPDETAELAELTIRDKANNRVDIDGFAFSPQTREYTLNVDYGIESVVLNPTVYKTAQRDIGVMVETFNDLGQWIEADDSVWDKKELRSDWYDNFADRNDPNKGLPSYKSHQLLSSGFHINLEPGKRVRVTLKVRAENPGTVGEYVIELIRNLPSDDSTLKSLNFVDEEGTEYPVSLQTGQLEYEIRIPYRTEKLQVLAETNHPGAVLNEKSYDPGLVANGWFGTKNWLEIPQKVKEDMAMDLLINVEAQNGQPDDASHYKIHIVLEEPSRVSTASTLEVTDADGNVLTLNPAFAGVLEDENAAYTVSIPYVTDKVRVRVTTDDRYSTIKLLYWETNAKRKLLEQEPATEALSRPIDIPVRSDEEPYYEIQAVITAESGEPNVTVYKLHIERAEPDTDAHLAGLELKDLEGEIQEFEDPFDPEVLNYEATVLYATDKVTVTPTVSSPTATVTVNGRKVESGQPSSNIRLDYPKYTDIEVKVTAQDGETTLTYRIRVRRAAPSSDSRLRALEVSDVDRLTPVFRPKELHYTANVNEGVTEVTVTATANDPFATIQIDGKDAVSGQPSEPIPLLDVEQTITIVVTAQDGKSSTTYTVDLYNTNMVEKSSNADLADLEVLYGLMTPEFASSVTSYEVAVKEDVYSVEIIPTPADPMAKVQVFAGTLEIGDEEGNFSQAIVDGENEFTVRVTAPDGSKTKDYTIMVYRNEEDKMGFLTPITAEDIDFENSGDIIVVDITKYPRVAADVFNTLKEYPEKTIIFEGNDYSLQFDAADIQKIIPHTDVFDFGLSFTSPNRDEIMSKIRRYDENDRARIVLIHFGDSKELPAPARFTLSLGRKYRDDQLYWHYWNEERSRIDYYGTVETNSKGTFAVKLERLGDYIIADQRIVGSEDKSTTLAADGDLTKDTSLLKTNPNTGERGEDE